MNRREFLRRSSGIMVPVAMGTVFAPQFGSWFRKLWRPRRDAFDSYISHYTNIDTVLRKVLFDPIYQVIVDDTEFAALLPADAHGNVLEAAHLFSLERPASLVAPASSLP